MLFQSCDPISKNSFLRLNNKKLFFGYDKHAKKTFQLINLFNIDVFGQMILVRDENGLSNDCLIHYNEVIEMSKASKGKKSFFPSKNTRKLQLSCKVVLPLGRVQCQNLKQNQESIYIENLRVELTSIEAKST